MSSSLSRFSGWRSRSLSLGEGLTDSTGARDGTRADGVLDRGRRRLFLFSVLRWRRRRATGSIAAGTWRRRPSPGYSMSSSLSRFSGWRSRSLSLGEGLTDSTGAPGWHPRCWCVGSRAAPAFTIKGNKAIADQPPLLKPFYKESRFQRTSTRQQLDYAKTQLLCSQENRRIPTFDGLSTCS